MIEQLSKATGLPWSIEFIESRREWELRCLEFKICIDERDIVTCKESLDPLPTHVLRLFENYCQTVRRREAVLKYANEHLKFDVQDEIKRLAPLGRGSGKTKMISNRLSFLLEVEASYGDSNDEK